MNVNPPLRLPRTVPEKVTVILTTLGLTVGDADLRRRIGTFITCNGYEAVLEAARETVKVARRQAKTIADPWPYTIRVYNTNIAHLEHLYILTHLAETGLRSQVNQHYIMGVGGDEWHRDPRRYVEPRLIADFVGKTKELGWGVDRAGNRIVERPDTPDKFLALISMSQLNQIALRAHAKTPLAILKDPTPKPGARAEIDHSRIERLLMSARDARNDVAHNRFVKASVFDERKTDLLDLLRILHFDVGKTLRGIVAQSSPIMAGVIAGLEGAP